MGLLVSPGWGTEEVRGCKGELVTPTPTLLTAALLFKLG